jgi:hypothetical protein
MLKEQLINPKLTMLKVKVEKPEVTVKGTHIDIKIHQKGYWIINGKVIENKLTANWIYLLASALNISGYTVTQQDNTTATTGGANYVHAPNSVSTNKVALLWLIMYGSSLTSPTISDYKLNSPLFNTNVVGAYEVESNSGAGIVLYNQFMVASQQTIYEMGLFFGNNLNNAPAEAILVSHLLFSNGLTIPNNIWIQHGYQLFFPVPFTIWIVRSIFSNAFKIWEGNYTSGGIPNGNAFTLITDINNNTFLPQYNGQINSWSLAIGTGTTPATPQDYALGSPLASLLSQTMNINIDKTNNAGYLTFSGTYSPSSNVTVGEIGLYGIIKDQSGNSHTVLLIHYVFSTPVSLTAGTQYTFSITIVA